MELRVKIDATEVIAGLGELEKNSLPFALAKTLTLTAKDAQKGVQAGLGSKFTLRNSFTRQGIRIKPAVKNSQRIEADVHTDLANRKTGAPDYMGLHEDGGSKFPVAGHQHIAVPTRFLRKYAPRIIPEQFRPKALLPPDAQLGQAHRGMFYRGETFHGSKQVISKGAMRKLGTGEFVAFLQRTHGGKLCIFVRKSGSRDAEPWYILISEARIKPRLRMEQDVTKIANSQFGPNWDSVWKDIRMKGLRFSY